MKKKLFCWSLDGTDFFGEFDSREEALVSAFFSAFNVDEENIELDPMEMDIHTGEKNPKSHLKRPIKIQTKTFDYESARKTCASIEEKWKAQQESEAANHRHHAVSMAMNDDELEDLGRATLHGSLPVQTQMRLFGTALRLKDERNKARKQAYDARAVIIECERYRVQCANQGGDKCAVHGNAWPCESHLDNLVDSFVLSNAGAIPPPEKA